MLVKGARRLIARQNKFDTFPGSAHHASILFAWAREAINEFYRLAYQSIVYQRAEMVSKGKGLKPFFNPVKRTIMHSRLDKTSPLTSRLNAGN